MSTKTDFQAKNARLNTNNTDLSSVLNIINNLPEYPEITLQEKTVSSSTSKQTVTPDSGYTGLSKVTVNAMATATQATPSISVSSSGLITASATQSAGYVASGTKSATKQLTTKGATTWTPKTSNQTIASGTYLTGTQTIKGDSNLIASNIRSGKSIFGVSGTLVEGITPTGTLEITENGTHDVTNYASANVNVASSGGSGKLETGGNMMWTYDTSTNDTSTLFRGRLEVGKTYELCMALGSDTEPLCEFTPIIKQQAINSTETYEYIGCEVDIEGLTMEVKDVYTFFGNYSGTSDLAQESIMVSFKEIDMSADLNFPMFIREV